MRRYHGQVKAHAKRVKVFAKTTLMFPFFVVQTFASHHEEKCRTCERCYVKRVNKQTVFGVHQHELALVDNGLKNFILAMQYSISSGN